MYCTLSVPKLSLLHLPQYLLTIVAAQVKITIITTLQALRQGCQKQLLVSSYLSVCPSLRPKVKRRLPLDGFLLNLLRLFEDFWKICRENSGLVKI